MGLFWRRKKIEDKEKRTESKTVGISDDKKTKKREDKEIVGSATKSMKELYSEKEDKKTKEVESVSKKTTAVKERKEKRKFGNAYKILLKPLVTEKAANLGTENKYVFAVASKANKVEIAKAVKEVYGIKPISVNIIKMSGKNVRSGRIIGKRKDWKKAIIALPKGESIKVYEGV